MHMNGLDNLYNRPGLIIYSLSIGNSVQTCQKLKGMLDQTKTKCFTKLDRLLRPCGSFPPHGYALKVKYEEKYLPVFLCFCSLMGMLSYAPFPLHPIICCQKKSGCGTKSKVKYKYISSSFLMVSVS